MIRSCQYVFLLVVVLLCSACSKVVLLQDLAQGDVNEILVVLYQNGINSEKEAIEKQQELSWTIKVDARDEVKARQVLLANNLPRQKELGLAGICKDSGMIPTPKMEKCREMLGLKGEIINSLRSIPGVVAADVVINMPDKEDFPDPNNPAPRPTASVVIQFDGRGAGNELLDESKVQQFVANTVNGMDMRDVAVIITRAVTDVVPVAEAPLAPVNQDVKNAPNQNPIIENSSDGESAVAMEEMSSVGGIEMSAQSVKKFKLVLGLVLFFFVVLSAALIAVLFRMAQLRKTGAPVTRTPAFMGGGDNAQIPDKLNMDQLVEEAGQATNNPGRRT